MGVKKENQAIDIFKLVCAYFVVAIHTALFLDINKEIWFYFIHMFCGIAVPFFFMCSGYYYNPNKDVGENSKWYTIPKQVKRLVIPYFFWSILYNLILRNFDVKELLKSYLIASPGASMWFVGAVMISMVILKFLKTKKALTIAIIVSYIFYFAGLFLNSYSGYLRGSVIGAYLLKYYIDIFESTRNFVFIGFPMMSVGYYLGQYGIPKFFQNKKRCIVSCLLALLVLLIEVNIVKQKPDTFSGGFSYFFSLPLLTVTVLSMLLQIELKLNMNTKVLRKVSTGIYFSHLVVLVCVNLLSGILWHFNIIENNFNTVIQFLVISLISTVGSIIIIKINNKYLNKLF